MLTLDEDAARRWSAKRGAPACSVPEPTVESCSVGTRVIVHDYGLLAHLIRRHGLGLVVDCNDGRSFRATLMALTANGDATERYVSRPFCAEAEATDEQHPPATAGIHTSQG